MLAGGVFAGVIGPQLVIFTKDLWPPYLFAATYLAQSVVAADRRRRADARAAFRAAAAARPAATGVRSARSSRTPRFIVAVACGVASYAMMNLVMTSAPLAMVGCGHSVTDATLGIQWHVLGMFAPSFFTGAADRALRRRARHPHRAGPDRR